MDSGFDRKRLTDTLSNFLYIFGSTVAFAIKFRYDEPQPL